jgi:hypothetical protein
MKLRERFVENIQSVAPGYKVVKKEDSRLMKFLAIILFFTKDFMTRFTTTVGNTVYMPEQHLAAGTGNLSTLAHEAQHIWDHQRWYGHVFYAVGYVLPQALAAGALLSLLAIWYSNWWLLCLLCLLFLAPIPAPFRAMTEKRGYLMSLAVAWWMYGNDDIKEQGWPIDSFAGPSYYYMWPFRKSLAKWFSSELKQIQNGKYPTPVFKVVHEFLQSENLTK